MDFASELSDLSSKVIPDMKKYIEQVKADCRSEAKKGQTIASVIVRHFFCTPAEIRSELEMLGLSVESARMALSGEKTFFLSLHWPDKREQHSQPPQKKRKRHEGSAEFASELSSFSSNVVPDMKKYIEQVQETCRREAKKGQTMASDVVRDFFCTPEEIRSELEMLGLEVKSARMALSGEQTLFVELRWSATRRSRQLSGLTSGNLMGTCKVCLDEEVMCRLHPCGHIVGSDCAKTMIDAPCPFCRQTVCFAHCLFEP